jgi:hypothetical protein
MYEEEIKQEREVRGNSFSRIKILLPALIVFILLVISALFLQLRPIGFAIISDEFDYTDTINLSIDNSDNYIWSVSNYGSLSSLRLDGSISKKGSAKVYLEHANELYLIFDSSRLSQEEIPITGLTVSDGTTNASLDNESQEITSDEPTEDKSITIAIEGHGSKALDDIFEFTTVSSFNWDVDYSKLCTKWSVNDVSLCYGAEDCCALIELDSLGNWNDKFYLTYGRYGAGLSNTVKAQLIYADYSLDPEQPYSNIIYSDIKETEAEFSEAIIYFTDLCIDTCILPDFNDTSYKLVFIIENATLNINNIRYSIEKELNVTEARIKL